MKPQTKAVLLLLTTFAASASAETLRGSPQGAREPSGALKHALVYEGEAGPSEGWRDEDEELPWFDEDRPKDEEAGAPTAAPGQDDEEARQSDVDRTVPVQVAGLEEDEDEEDDSSTASYDEDELVATSKSGKSSKSTKKPTKKPSPSSSSRSSRKPTKKPTKKPSPSSRSERDADCLDETEPKAKRNGEKYKFELKKSHHMCLDKEKRKYQYGEFKDVKKDSDCARNCVEYSRSNILGSLEGFDFSCKKERCRCLFDEGALNSNKAKPYDSYNLDGDGDGEVKETKKKDDTYCFKLKAVKFVGLDGEFDDEDDGDYEMESR